MNDYTGMIESSVQVVKCLMTEAFNQNRRQRTNDDEGRRLFDFFRLLAVCHTIVVDKDPKTNEVLYQASSPDELALIQGAKQMGLVLQERTQQFMRIHNTMTGELEEYEIKREFPFDSDRKRMTLIVKHQNRYMLICKGADSIMLPRLTMVNKCQQ